MVVVRIREGREEEGRGRERKGGEVDVEGRGKAGGIARCIE